MWRQPLYCTLALALSLLLLATPSVANEKKLLVLGDSISAAYGMSLQQGWVALLEKRLADGDSPVGIVNASISGETTRGGLRRLPALLEQHKPQYVVVELGANDGLRGYPISEFSASLSRIVELAQSVGAAVLLLPMEIPPNYGARYTDAFREVYRQVATTSGATLGPFILEQFATDALMMQNDGIHPTAKAQPLIVETVLPAILSLLGTQ